MLFIPSVHQATGDLAGFLPSIVGAAVRSSIILVIALIMTSLMRRTSAAARHLVWISSILGTLAVLLIVPVAPRWNARMLPRSTLTDFLDAASPKATATLRAPALVPLSHRIETPAAAGATTPPTPAAPQPTMESTPQSMAPVAAAARQSWSAAEWIALIWLVVALAVIARLALGTLIVWRTAQRAERVDDADWLVLVTRAARALGISRPVTLLKSAEQTVPVTWGLVYPVVLLPESATGWEPDRREAVIMHELAHIGRLDALTQMVMQMALAIFWFNPLLWIAARHVRAERERACDDLVLSHGTRASFYADDLLAMVRTLTRNTEPAFAALAMARRSEFEGRMLAILDPRIDRSRLGRRGAAIAIVTALLIALPLAALRPLPRKAMRVSSTASSAISTNTGSGTRWINARSNARSNVRGDHAACNSSPGNHTSFNSENSGATWMISDSAYCIVARSVGTIHFADDDAHVKTISAGGHLEISEWIDGLKHHYEAKPDGKHLDESYTVNGKPTDAAARDAWLRSVILQMVRQDASFAPERAARIRKQRGIAGVLAEVSAINFDYGKSAYLEALLDEGNIPSDSVPMIGAFGAKQLSSNYYKSPFLTRVSHLSGGSTSGILVSAARTVSSDYSKHQSLSAALAEGGQTDAVSKQVDVAARQAIDAANSVASDYDRASLLMNVLSLNRLNDSVLMALMESANGITDDYSRSSVLDSVAISQSLSSKRVYTTLLRSADGISSDHSHADVLKHILARRDILPPLAAATIRDAAALHSDAEKVNVLITAAATSVAKNPAVREAYLWTSRTITSGTDQRRAMSAILP